MMRASGVSLESFEGRVGHTTTSELSSRARTEEDEETLYSVTVTVNDGATDPATNSASLPVSILATEVPEDPPPDDEPEPEPVPALPVGAVWVLLAVVAALGLRRLR